MFIKLQLGLLGWGHCSLFNLDWSLISVICSRVTPYNLIGSGNEKTQVGDGERPVAMVTTSDQSLSVFSCCSVAHFAGQWVWEDHICVNVPRAFKASEAASLYWWPFNHSLPLLRNLAQFPQRAELEANLWGSQFILVLSSSCEFFPWRHWGVWGSTSPSTWRPWSGRRVLEWHG